MKIWIENDLWERICGYLDTAKERVVFLFVSTDADSGDWSPIDEWFLDVRSDYGVSEELHVALSPEVLPKVFKRAHDLGAAVLEVHSHPWPGKNTSFSRFDLFQLHELIPQVLWRLPHRPYFALVLGRESFDAIAWEAPNCPVHVEFVKVGHEVLYPTRTSLQVWEEIGLEPDK